MYGIARKKWLDKFLELPNGIPSHDTFARVFSQINPEEFNKSFLNWVKGISKIIVGEIIAFDGKQSRNSQDEKNDRGVINTVSAWATSKCSGHSERCVRQPFGDKYDTNVTRLYLEGNRVKVTRSKLATPNFECHF